ncbi:MAG TPA: alpha-ketoglutarate-dependent dioxygenase AlkB [Terriglobales bacterium]|nr:alpha-ketoglutarate-dependent dioxygenase AlkB [Terriglobales bacterium]
MKRAGSESMIAGLHYLPEYLDRNAHDQLIAAADREQWLMTIDHPVQVYGHSYNPARNIAFHIGDLPTWATNLAVRLWQDGLLPAVPDQLVVNDYPPGTGIFPHIDQAAFGDVVASVSLGSSCVMEFSREGSIRKELLLEARSAVVLSGEVRWNWKHEIPARLVDVVGGQEYQRERRLSLTFRVMPARTKQNRPKTIPSTRKQH